MNGPFRVVERFCQSTQEEISNSDDQERAAGKDDGDMSAADGARTGYVVSPRSEDKRTSSVWAKRAAADDQSESGVSRVKQRVLGPLQSLAKEL